MYAQGWCTLSIEQVVSQTMSPKWFVRQELLSLELRMTGKLMKLPLYDKYAVWGGDDGSCRLLPDYLTVLFFP